MLPEKLEQKLGAQHMQKLDDAERNQAMECPPVSPHLLRHLRLMFADITRAAKPNNPMLGQLLTIQFGCNKVIDYLQQHYEAQSAAARKERQV